MLSAGSVSFSDKTARSIRGSINDFVNKHYNRERRETMEAATQHIV
jgi:hypothetical protein